MCQVKGEDVKNQSTRNKVVRRLDSRQIVAQNQKQNWEAEKEDMSHTSEGFSYVPFYLSYLK